MKIWIPEHSNAAYVMDFIVYGVSILALAIYLLIQAPQSQAGSLFALVLIGLLAWSAIEYLIHRFVLHGLQPFQAWHEEHHRRPEALIRTPTILSASLILILIFLPMLLFGGNLWRACALSLGLLIGYYAYTITHHAIHHWKTNNTWLLRRQQWHGLHHDLRQPGRFGVTSQFWDGFCKRFHI